jgi:replication-associated recombination protein RarA
MQGQDDAQQALPVRDARREPPPTLRGYDFGECASALQKSCRRCLVDDALYWGLELERAGYEEYVWSRLFVICSEDIGLAEPGLPADLSALYEQFRMLKARKNQARVLQLTHAIILCAKAKKSRMVCNALATHHTMIDEGIRDRQVPDYALDKHTLAGRRMRRGFRHFYEVGALVADPETGELTEEGAFPDPYRAKAMKAQIKPVREESAIRSEQHNDQKEAGRVARTTDPHEPTEGDRID